MLFTVEGTSAYNSHQLDVNSFRKWKRPYYGDWQGWGPWKSGVSVGVIKEGFIRNYGKNDVQRCIRGWLKKGRVDLKDEDNDEEKMKFSLL